MLDIELIRHNWPEPAGFDLYRRVGAPHWILIHFLSSAEFMMDNQWRTLGPGDLIILPPYQSYRLVAPAPLLHDWMHFNGEVEESLARFGLEKNRVYHIAQSAQITSRIARLESEFLARDYHWQECSKALLDELWITIKRQVNGRITQPVMQQTADQLRELRTAMILHPEQPWTNEMMASRVNISVSRLYPLYKRLFSISPGRDVILIRVEKAKKLLEQGCSVTETADLLGYGSTYHFIRQFRTETGVTPGKWNR